jgi:hypothetical protein
MNNLTLVGVLGIAGYAAYKVHDNRVRATQNSAFTALLTDDDKQVVPANKLNIAQTAANLTDLYFRKNAGEITLQAGVIQGKGYMKTAMALLQYAGSIAPVNTGVVK